MSRRSLAALAALSWLGITFALPFDAQAQTPDTSPAAAALEEWVEVYNGQDMAVLERFAQERYQTAWLAQTSATQLAINYRNWFANYGEFRFVAWVSQSALTAEAVVYSRALDACHGVSVELDRNAPEQIEGVYLEPFTARACPHLEGPTNWRRFQRAVRRDLDELAGAGRFDGVFLVRYGGRTIVHEARGRAGLAPLRRNTRDTPFELASVSKLFTAVAVARLAQSGRLSLDDTIAQVLPSYPDQANAARITVRRLLTHTSGFGDYYRSGAIFADPRARMRLEEYWPLFAGRPLSFEPGARYDYSNTNYVLLGSIVENIAGERFEDFVTREIFDRVGMRSACYCAPAAARRAATPLSTYTAGAGPARRVSPAGLAEVPQDAPRPAVSAGYALASAMDLARFGESIMKGDLLDQATFQQMISPVVAMDDGGSKGLGFEVYDLDGVRLVGHGGNSWGVTTQLDIYPDAEIVVVILSNLEASGAAALRYKTRRWISALVRSECAPVSGRRR